MASGASSFMMRLLSVFFHTSFHVSLAREHRQLQGLGLQPIHSSDVRPVVSTSGGSSASMSLISSSLRQRPAECSLVRSGGGLLAGRLGPSRKCRQVGVVIRVLLRPLAVTLPVQPPRELPERRHPVVRCLGRAARQCNHRPTYRLRWHHNLLPLRLQDRPSFGK